MLKTISEPERNAQDQNGSALRLAKRLPSLPGVLGSTPRGGGEWVEGENVVGERAADPEETNDNANRRPLVRVVLELISSLDNSAG